MSLDITIKERKEFRCPDCGRLVTTQDIDAECSGGRVWYEFLESVGYYDPHVEPEYDAWYGEDMILAEEQAQKLIRFVLDYQPTEYDKIEHLVESALVCGNKVVINADW